MCTLVLARNVHPDYPLVLAANRDEFHARPATGPTVLLTRPRAVGGRDAERGGTWMGVTDGGLFVGLTNRRTATLEPARRSRGEVVLEALAAGSVAGVERLLATLSPADFNPFHLLFADAHAARVAYARPGEPRLEVQPVPDGVHVLPNDVLDAPLPKVARLRSLAAPLFTRPWEQLLPGLQAAMADHGLPAPDTLPAPPAGAAPLDPEVMRRLQAVCVHAGPYGTRSCAVVALQPGRVAHYVASDAPPCQGPFRDVTALLADAAP